MTNEQLVQIKSDFMTGMDQETLQLSPDSVDVFWAWFRNNAVLCHPAEIEYDKYVDEMILRSRCFGNAQHLHLTEGWDYFEGFFKVKGSFILHGFNLVGANVLDLTVLTNQADFLDHNQTLPFEYLGINIPSEFVKTNAEEIGKHKHYNTSRLLSYFKSIT
jgi:hypothetical protein